MAKLVVNIGTSVNDKAGDPLRTAFNKINLNFTDLYTKFDSIDHSTLSSSSAASIVSNNLSTPNTWTFNTNGTITFPDSSVQSTAATQYVNTFNFTAGINSTNYNALLTDSVILVNNNGQDPVSVTLPSAAPTGKVYTIKKTISFPQIINITTDNIASCLIDELTTQSTSTAYGFFTVIKASDGNYWITGKY